MVSPENEASMKIACVLGMDFEDSVFRIPYDRLMKGRTLTAWVTIQDDLDQIGANVKDQPVVKDRNWITSRKPGDLQQFSAAIIDSLEGADSDVRELTRAALDTAQP